MTMIAAGTAPRRARLTGWGATFALSLAVLLGFWMVVGLPGGTVETMVMGNDAGMRLLTLRDLLVGHGWFDATQPRLGPEGTPMHWSRLVDAPMLALILALEPVLGREGAEFALLLVWPLAMLAAIVATAAAIARRLGGGLAGGLAIGAGLMALVIKWRFVPGDIDHHNVQALLLMLAIWGMLARHDHRAAAPGAGLAVAASLCIGVETLPLLVMTGLWCASLWAARGAAERAPALGFAGGLGGGLALLFPLTAPAIAWYGGFCDAISVDLAVPVMAGAGLLGGLAWGLSDRPAGMRAAALLGGGIVLVLAVAALRPTCLSNPYDALDPYLAEHWLARTTEAQGIVDKVAQGRMIYLILTMGALAAAAALPAVIGRRGLPLSVLLLAGLAIGAYQVRGLLMVMILTLLAGSVVAGVLRDRAAARPGPWGAPLALAALLSLALLSVLMGFGQGFVDETEERAVMDPDAPLCSEAGAFAALGALPPGRVAATSDLGVPILLSTPHTVLAAPYHRNQDGLRAAFEILLARTDAEAERVMRASGVDYFVVCPADGDIATFAAANGDIFSARVAAGRVPAFLAPMPGTETAAARIYTLR